MDPAALVVEDVHKSYRGHEVLTGVSLAVRPGEALGLLGPNGAGKTTLIRMVLDLTRPDAGRLRVLGEPPSSRLKDRVGYLPEERGLYPKQRVQDVLSYLVGLAGVPPNEARRRSLAWLERVGLGPWARKKVSTLSKGMQQKVQLGAAILHEPELVILDEPFTGLDPVNRRLVADVVGELKARGAGVVISTHLLDQVEQLCDGVVLLHAGRELLSGPVEAVRSRAAEGWIELKVSGDWAGHPAVAPLLAEVRRRAGRDEVRLADDASPEALLGALLTAGFEVAHFSRALPSLDEVFVRSVLGAAGGDPDALRAQVTAGGAP